MLEIDANDLKNMCLYGTRIGVILKIINMLKKIFIFFILLCIGSPLHSVPDVTIVGFIKPEDGLGKIPLNIIETLGTDISSNFIGTQKQVKFPIDRNILSPLVNSSLDNPDQDPGKVAIYTDFIWDKHGKHCDIIPKDSLIKLAYSMIESTAIPPQWVEILNNEFDAVIVPDKFLVGVYQNSGVHIPIFVLPVPMKLSAYFVHPPHSSKPGKPFVFIDASANKNPLVLIKAFAKAFDGSKDVRLLMRAVSLYKHSEITKLLEKYDLSNVILEQGSLSLDEYIEELSSCDCYVNLSRGEGFSLIPREALSLGLPVIITNNTASATICESGFATSIPSDIKGPTNPYYRTMYRDNCGEQFDCRVSDVVAALQDMYNHYSEHHKKASEGRKWVARYDCDNPELKLSYQTLVKPKRVELGDNNVIQDGTLITNSLKLFEKFKIIASVNEDL